MKEIRNYKNVYIKNIKEHKQKIQKNELVRKKFKNAFITLSSQQYLNLSENIFMKKSLIFSASIIVP